MNSCMGVPFKPLRRPRGRGLAIPQVGAATAWFCGS
jgi:hypothetical protein